MVNGSGLESVWKRVRDVYLSRDGVGVSQSARAKKYDWKQKGGERGAFLEVRGRPKSTV